MKFKPSATPKGVPLAELVQFNFAKIGEIKKIGQAAFTINLK
jgi:hypothetical protein